MDNKKSLMIQLMRFAFVGGTAFIIDAGLLFILTDLFSVHYIISNTISVIISIIYNYILSVNWVYNTRKGRSETRTFIIFSVLSIIGLGLNQALMAVFVDLFKIYYMFSKVLITAIVMVYNFVTRKLFLEGK